MRRSVSSMDEVIVPVSFLTILNSSLNEVRMFSTSVESSDMVFAVCARPSRSSELTLACLPDSVVRETISFIMAATFLTCELISVVISWEEAVWD